MVPTPNIIAVANTTTLGTVAHHSLIFIVFQSLRYNRCSGVYINVSFVVTGLSLFRSHSANFTNIICSDSSMMKSCQLRSPFLSFRVLNSSSSKGTFKNFIHSPPLLHFVVNSASPPHFQNFFLDKYTHRPSYVCNKIHQDSYTSLLTLSFGV